MQKGSLFIILIKFKSNLFIKINSKKRMIGTYSSNGSANQKNVYVKNGRVYYYSDSSREQYISTNCILYH